jgi:2-oxoglutarate ferredoxin oxidoreductase subunit delta
MEQNSDPEKEMGQPQAAAAAPAGGKPAEKALPEYEIDIFRDWCKACGICAAFCPRQCLDLDENGSPVVQDAKRCTGCGWCELHCPDFAISVRECPEKVAQEEAD